ncbi:MAG TPA: 7TM diverse intracellular signaling domain-containing protein [Ramlibacter sp.]|jgi:diguanylate cyclase (GGDEF)-like protein|nr:7TM diverse intracellular signaling domain-containing protein [Ramlibacter sp.]
MPIALRDAQPQLRVEDRVGVWIDAAGDASVGEAVRAQFRPASPGAVYDLPPEAALWMHLRVQRGPMERHQWLLKLPMPLLDRVTVFQADGAGWREESAGDTLAVRQWPEPGRYPLFRLAVRSGETRDVYVRIRHATAASFPVELVTASRHSAEAQVEYLVLGLAFGALLLLIASCLAKGWAYRDPVFGWYALYAAVTCLAVASFTGVAAHVLWPGFGLLQDAPTAMLACAAVGAALLFIRGSLGLRRRLPLPDRLMLWLGVAGLVMALLPPFTAKSLQLAAVGTYVVVATVAALAVSAWAWSRGDTVARWVFLAQLPMVLSVLVNVFRTMGWANIPVASQYLVVASLTVEVPLLLVALFIRSRDRHSAQVREQALSSQDALTGLLAPHLFTDRLRQVVARFKRNEQNAAVMYIDLVNHGRIREVFGAAVAEQSLLRSVIKLRRLLRDVDTVSRVGETRFGVILEGASSRSSVTERATRLIAAGLMPLPGLKPDVTLQFHVAALLLSERPLEAEEVQAVLDAQLTRMSPRTRRPIRFIQPEQELTSDPVNDSVMFTPDAGPESATSAFAPAR